MDSKKSFKLIWRLFLPIAVLLWSIIGLLGWYTISHERQVRRNNLEMQLKNVNATVLDAYERGIDLQRTLNFIRFYTSNTVLNDLRVTVFNDFASEVARVGNPIIIEDSGHRLIPEIIAAEREGVVTAIRPALSDSRESMFNIMTSNDGSIRSVAVIPYNANVEHALSYDAIIWIVVLALAFCATAVAYAIARKVSLSVNSLHHFAVRAANGIAEDIGNMRFPHDELGDVSREIVRLYREKDKALVRLEHEHKVAIRATEEQARIKRQTANNVNHELKTPVGIIKGYLDTIVSDPDMPASLRNSFIKKAQAHADRLTQLLKDVSSITRLDDGAQQVEISDFDFHDLIYNISNDLEVSKINGPMEFEWSVPFDTFISGNYTLLSNAILNLIRNAAKYSCGTCMTLDLVRQDDKFCYFVFADNGNGVGEEHIPHLFDRFYRVDEGRTRKSGGTGLGLPIVKSTFDALGGDIKVRNIKPHGLAFDFKLPRAPKTENEQ